MVVLVQAPAAAQAAVAVTLFHRVVLSRVGMGRLGKEIMVEQARHTQQSTQRVVAVGLVPQVLRQAIQTLPATGALGNQVQ